jgi:deoxyribonuclease-4
MSVAGGLHNAFVEGKRVGCDCLQVFVKNQRQWSAPPLTDEAVRLWKAAQRETGIGPVVAHGAYLINLASPDAALWHRSVDAFCVEMTRCEQLGIPYLVIHPGSHVGRGEAFGLRRAARAVNAIHRRCRGFAVRILLETTAGQGTSVGHRFEHLRAILDRVREPERVGVCVDTCHVFAAGYALAKAEAYAATIDALDAAVGLARVCCVHVNDSMRERGARVDRHAHIGKGKLGRAGFRNLVADGRFRHVPFILETPKGKDGRGRDFDKMNLAALRRMARGASDAAS